jgi:gliding motility-associated-like protein
MYQSLNIIYKILFFSLITLCAKSQIIFLQNNIKGGVCGDGVSYFGKDYLQADTIIFSNFVPTGSLIKKAYLFTYRLNYEYDNIPEKDTRLELTYNNNKIIIDSSAIISPMFNCDNSIVSGKNWICALDVTNYTTQNNNVLIVPCQNCLMLEDTSRGFVYDGFYLMIIYENNLMQNVNVLTILNNKTYYTNMNYAIQNLNPIDNSKDVGLSIWTNNVHNTLYGDYRCEFTLNSSAGQFYLGKLDMTIGNFTFNKSLPGSFYYENNNLYGLVDDTPNQFIDSTDALTNIKTFVLNNTTGFTLTSNSETNAGCVPMIEGFFLAYSTPCPTSVSKDTSISICRGQSVQLNSSSGFSNYNWYPKTGLNDSTIANPIANPIQSTNYIAYVKDANGCMHTEHTQLIVHGAPVPDTIAITNAVCGVQEGAITITPNYHNYFYTYSIGTGITTDTSFNNLSAGNYTLTVTDDAGCTYLTNFTINEVNPVNAGFSIQTATSIYTAPLYVHVSNNTSGATNYNWYFPTATASTYNSDYTFTNSGTYTITLIAYNNTPTCADTATLTITVLPEDTAGIFIPNIFSPNGDGNNDVFEIKIMNATLELVEIYDRWGVQVCNALDLTTTKNANSTSYAWTGRSTSGMECSSGTYFYCIKIKPDAKYNKGESKTYTGFISVIR